jgi:Uma2 family endonuclease
MLESTTLMATKPVATEADLLKQPDDGWKYELVDGEIRRLSPAGGPHGRIAAELTFRLIAHVKRQNRKTGHVFDSSTGFRLTGGNVRAPDVSFVSIDRLPDVPAGYVPVAPDLAVEILSPDDGPRYVLEKVGEYLDAGVRLVWVIDPKGRKAIVYRSVTAVRTLTIEDALDGEEVLPGFQCVLREVLA